MPIQEQGIVPGEYVVKYPTEPPTENYKYAIDVYGRDFDAGSRANLSSGDPLTVLPGEPVKVNFKGVPWYTAQARPHDGSWLAVRVEVITADGETIQGRIPIKNFDWLTPVTPESSVIAGIG